MERQLHRAGNHRQWQNHPHQVRACPAAMHTNPCATCVRLDTRACPETTAIASCYNSPRSDPEAGGSQHGNSRHAGSVGADRNSRHAPIAADARQSALSCSQNALRVASALSMPNHTLSRALARASAQSWLDFEIRYMTTTRTSEMGHGVNKHRTSLASQTTESKLYTTPKIKIDGVSVSLKLREYGWLWSQGHGDQEHSQGHLPLGRERL